MGAGTGTGFGDGSGGNALMIAGYVKLAGGEEGGRTEARDPRPEISGESEAVGEVSPQSHSVRNFSVGEDPLAPAAQAPPPESHARAVPVLSPESMQKDHKNQRRTAAKPALARTKQEDRAKIPPAAGKQATAVASAEKRAGAGLSASQQGEGNASSPGNGAGDGSGRGTGGRSGSLNAGGSGAAGFGYALNMVDRIPKVLKRGPVPYPEAARKMRLTGNVTVRFLLSEKGEMSRVHVLRADPPEVFNGSAVAAVKKWKFSPAVKDGKPVPVWVELPLRFALR